MASVTGALRRMSREGLVNYGAREFVELTDEGAELARKILQRDEFLRQFLSGTLGLDNEIAEKDACSLEHHLSPETLSRLVALHQFMQTYGHSASLSRFLEDGTSVPCAECPHSEESLQEKGAKLSTLSGLEPGTSGKVAWLDGDAIHRLGLVEKGLLPRVRVTMESHHDGRVRVRIKGSPVRLSEDEAAAVHIVPEADQGSI